MSSGSGNLREREALQSALAAEHAAVYAYGVIGGVLSAASDAGVALANSCYATHRGRRDRLISVIGERAIAAQPVYGLPFEVTGAGRARRLGVHVEQRCAAVYANVVSRTTDDNREYAVLALQDCAVRGLGWGAEPESFPGLRGR